ncbi:MAG: DNA gyrase subunit A, partial [Oscillospiraceae bacterium]|nr:DNA gyrase subunit A [Oscillospiraceae bacterium]
GMRVVVEVKKDANPQVVLNQLYRYTQLQDTVGVILLALDKGIPKIMTLKTMIQRYVEFQDEVIRRRTRFDLKKAKERAHIQEGLKRAVDIVDEVIYTIRHCGGGQAEAKAAIMEKFGFTDPQADAICKFPLGRLAGLEIKKIEAELEELHRKIEEWESILLDDAKVLEIVKEELLALKEKYGDDRRTEIAAVSGEVDIEDLIPEEDCVFTLTHEGYIKRQPKDTYQAQRRGGRGISSMATKDEDFVEELFVGSTHDYVLFVTNLGRIYRLKGYQIYEGSRASKGSNIVNILPLQPGEKVTTMLRQTADSTGAEAGELYVTMVTRKGLIKRTPLSQYANIRKSGLAAITFFEGDGLAWTKLTTGSDELMVATRNGLAIRFNEADARAVGRTSHGVRAINLAEGDEVVGAGILREGAAVFTVTENGRGRRTRLEEYRLQNRGGKGIRNFGKGGVAGIKVVDEADDIILISQGGVLIRMHVSDVAFQSRYGSGVRVMRLGEGDRVVTLARTDHDEEAEVAKVENEPEEELTAEERAALEAEEAAQAEEAPAGEEE